jgi:signal transduction histidine kinase
MTDPTDRLLAATRRRLFVITFGLVALLVVGISITTVVAGLRALDSDVDRSLQAAVEAAVGHLEGTLPSDSGDETDESAPAAADTFVLYLDPTGKEVANPSRVALAGLPDPGGVASAQVLGRDLRTVRAGSTSVRLLTVPVLDHESGAVVGYAQGGFVLDLHDRQSTSLVAATTFVALVGLVAAALVTLVVTGRALIPIRRSFEAQRRFVADASHELRTPAALIRANAEVLQREDLVAEDGRPLVQDVVSEADRLGRLVGDLLAIASSDATGLALERTPFDLTTLAAETVRGLAALAAEHGVQLIAEDAGPVTIQADRDRLVQLIVILVDNAIDHSPTGGQVVVRVASRGRNAELSVEDQGPGVPVAERERIFEPFTRLPGVRRDRSEGTGLGLAIARRIVAAHGGSIVVDDGPGGGARFVVSLPSGGAAAV